MDDISLGHSSRRDSADGAAPTRARRSPGAGPDAIVTSVDEEARELIGQMAGGHRPALERLYDRHAPVVFSLVLRILQNLDRGPEPFLDWDLEFPLAFLRGLVGQEIGSKLDTLSVAAMEEVSHQLALVWEQVAHDA